MLISMPKLTYKTDFDSGSWVWMLIFGARWMFYSDVISFRSLLESFASMTDVIMLGCWTIFSDAAGVVGNRFVAVVFFYSFKVKPGREFSANVSYAIVLFGLHHAVAM